MQLPEKDQNEAYEFVNHASRVPKKKISPITLGLIFLAGGFICSYFFIYQKIQQMAEHSASISYSMKAMMLGPMLIIFGLYYALIRPEDLNPVSPRDKKWLYIFVGIFIVAMIALYAWFTKIAEGYGYSL